MPTLRQARLEFFQAAGFPLDGGYDDDFSEAEFGPVLYRVRNTEARREALERHDLHHLVTGYATDWKGEAEISAWELASGFGRTPYAWIIMLWGLFTGLVGNLGPTFEAFVRGRGSTNLYTEDIDDTLLNSTVEDLRARLRVRPQGELSVDVLVGFAAWSVAALAWGLVAIPAVALYVLSASTPRCFSCPRCLEA